MVGNCWTPIDMGGSQQCLPSGFMRLVGPPELRTSEATGAAHHNVAAGRLLEFVAVARIELRTPRGIMVEPAPEGTAECHLFQPGFERQPVPARQVG